MFDMQCVGGSAVYGEYILLCIEIVKMVVMFLLSLISYCHLQIAYYNSSK